MRKLIAGLLLLLPVCVLAQGPTPEEALEKFSKYPQEKIYLHFDKGNYLAGETARFKAYIFSGGTLSRISTNLYIECLDRNKRLLYNNLLPVASGIAEGSLAFPKTFPEDVYYVRAYTSWMLNFSETFHFVQPLNIYNPASLTRLVQSPVAWEASAHPEGGTLLANTECEVAVRLHATGLLPQKWSGYLFEGADSATRLSEFTSLNEEIASFRFQPLPGKQYSVRLTDENHTTRVVALPPVAAQGFALQAGKLREGIAFRLAAKGIGGNLSNCKLVAQQEGQVLYSALIKSPKEEVNGIIPLDSATRGLVHLTLFDASGKAACERLCFIEALPNAVPSLQLQQTSGAKRGLNEWKVALDTANLDSYSLEVLNASTPVAEEGRSLFTTLWLGDLATVPYKGDWYFHSSDPYAFKALDDLLITEKWARFRWDELLKDPTPKPTYLPDYFLSYEGVAKRNKKPLVNKEVNMLFQLKDSSKILINVKTDSIGRFRLRNLIFRDTAKVYFQANTQKANATNIDIDFRRLETIVPLAGSLPPARFASVKRSAGDSIPAWVKEYHNNQKNKETADERYKMLEAVSVKGTRRDATERLNRQLSTGMFQSIDETLFDFVNNENDAIGYGSIFDWLQGRVAGLTFQSMEGDLVPYIRNARARIFRDEFEIAPSEVGTIPTSEIAMVKVLKNGFSTGGPSIAIYTLRAGITPRTTVASLPSNTLAGYPKVDKFQELNPSELYDKSRVDTRSVLYWNTRVKPENGTETIKFYNNDISNRVRMIILGFTGDGRPVYLNKEITL
ncbi:hypothetical protein V9K67_24060 [Paraflavisolibacter sp. H34]|uniref:hypothetical protein n=1 Tax=Huijunlia imazamoxiresistens TaxID=3127457 RepID=UPI00301B5810